MISESLTRMITDASRLLGEGPALPVVLRRHSDPAHALAVNDARAPEPSESPSCRARKAAIGDNLILDLAAEVGALLIVSSDTDLLSRSPWRGTPIIGPAAFAAEAGAMRRHARRRRG